MSAKLPPRAMNANGVPCPTCGGVWSRTYDSRPGGGDFWRRRRECKACGERFTTHEQVAEGSRSGVTGKVRRFDPEPVRKALTRALALLPGPAPIRNASRLPDNVRPGPSDGGTQ